MAAIYCKADIARALGIAPQNLNRDYADRLPAHDHESMGGQLLWHRQTILDWAKAEKLEYRED